jgi:hypothetical protein
LANVLKKEVEMSQWAYDMSNGELIDAFAQACAKSGVSNSGLCIDPWGPLHATEAYYLKGVLLARMEGLKPPLKRGDVVRSKSDQNVHSVDYLGPSLAHDSDQTIHRINYGGNGKWLLEFFDVPREERGIPQFNIDDFVLKSSVATVVK